MRGFVGNHVRMSLPIILMLFTVLTVLPSSVCRAEWQSVGSGQLNVNIGKDAGFPAIAFNPSTNEPYVTWSEDSGLTLQIYVKHFTGGNWESVGAGTLNVDVGKEAYSSTARSIAFNPSTNEPYVTWDEYGGGVDLTYVKRFTSGTWQMVGTGPLDVTPTSSDTGLASIAFDPSTSRPYVAWNEQSISGSPRQLYVKSYEEPTLVELISFTGRQCYQERGLTCVCLKWKTASELDNAGFQIWRANRKLGAYSQISEALIPAEGSPVQGAIYRYEDCNVLPGKRYFYKLEDIDLGGVDTFHGPVTVKVTP